MLFREVNIFLVASIVSLVSLNSARGGVDSKTTNPTNDPVVGRWIDPLPYGMGLMTIEKKGSHYILLAEPTFAKPYTMDLRRVGRLRFDYSDSSDGDYVVIRSDGRLDTGDKLGRAQTLNAAPDRQNQETNTAAVVAAQKATLCKHDLNCTITGKIADAAAQCRASIAHSSRWDYRWTDGVSPFVGYRWNPKAPLEKGLVDFYGDRVQFQNGFGAWFNMNYVCTYDTVAGRVANIKMRPGHLSDRN